MSVFNRLKQVATVSTVVLCMSMAAVNQATAAERFIVSGVENWDTLNIRSQPSARSAIIGEIPSDGTGVNSTGQETQNGRTTWVKVNWNGVTGWVSKRYLATDYSYKPAAPAQVKAPNYIQNPDYTNQGSERTGSIYDAQTGTVRSVYVGPGNGLPAIKQKQPANQYVPKANNANTHTHPANPCTRSVSHTHPNGANQHTHRYSCQGQATQRQPQVQVRAANNANTHTHPRNQFTNAVTHTHASGSAQHSHNYGGQPQAPVQQQTQTHANTHTHPRNQFTNAVTHTHASGSAQHSHNYGGQPQAPVQQKTQVTTQSNMVTHIHPATQYNKQTQHTHPGGAGVHIHDFLMPPRQAVKPAAQVSANTHTHPKNSLTNSVTHTHPNGANQHSHSYGQR